MLYLRDELMALSVVVACGVAPLPGAAQTLPIASNAEIPLAQVLVLCPINKLTEALQFGED